MRSPEGTTPFDVSELQKCAICHEGMAHGNQLTFYEVEIRQCMLDPGNIQRLHGMEMMMGNAALGRVFSDTTTVAHRIGDKTRRLVCQECGIGNLTYVGLLAEGGDA
jgi:hypothetical protein